MGALSAYSASFRRGTTLNSNVENLMAGESTRVLTEIRDSVATVTLSYPEKRNPIGTDTAEALVNTLTALDADDTVRVIVLTGAGEAFSAGGNLQEFVATVDAGACQLWDTGAPWQKLCGMIPSLGKPVIARIDGPAMAGACGLVACCDFAYATERSVFGTPEIKLGLFTLFILPGMLRCLSRRDALDLAFTGRTIDAVEAQRMGLINRVVPDVANLDRVVSEQAALLARIEPATMRRSRHAFARIESADFEQGLELARGLRPVFMASEELRRGIQKFLSK